MLAVKTDVVFSLVKDLVVRQLRAERRTHVCVLVVTVELPAPEIIEDVRIGARPAGRRRGTHGYKLANQSSIGAVQSIVSLMDQQHARVVRIECRRGRVFL